ncbi:MAG TPA: septal ring lytic transglycosylase RlpA family protein [Caulobacteraceae bacterium]|nr:septal ring lytic transglycosylase RlpA family protein [Caulobacteraceae bacterium]
MRGEEMVVRVSTGAFFRGSDVRGLFATLTAGVSLAACASTTPEMAARGVRPHVAAPAVATAAPPAAAAPRYKLGAPYQAAGLWYVPAEEPDYDEVGVASWYGEEFDGKPTANGEIFDKHSASAAHTTLPMPSIVEVTNLENGRSIRVRLNDRGPFKAGRIIDLSRAGAEELGYADKGTAKVRVRYVGPARMDGSLEPLYVAADTRTNIRPPLRQGEITESPLLPPQAALVLPGKAPQAPASPSAWRVADAGAAAQGAGQGGYAVQAGAFADRARAETVANTLSSAGAAAVRPVAVASRQLYRVVVGPWRDEAQARAAREQVAQLGFADARVVKAF